MRFIGTARFAQLVLGVAVVVVVTSSAPLAAPPAADPIAADPDVQGAMRLFSAWVEGQILNRHLPGIAVGVVSDQQLVWTQGFGFADVERKLPMTPQTKFRMASHSKLFTATAIMQLREQGKLRLDDPVSTAPAVVQGEARGADDAAHHHRAAADAQLRAAARGRRALDHVRVPDAPRSCAALMPERQAAFAPEVRWKYSNLAYPIAGMVVEEVSGERGPTTCSSTSSSARHDRVERGQGRAGPRRRLRPAHAGRIARKSMPFIDARGMAAATGITSTVEDMAKFVSAQFRKGPAAARQILGTGSLREMHRVRLLENNWTQGNAIGFAVRRDRRQGLRVARRRLSRLHDADDAPARRQGRRHRPHQRQRLESRRDGAPS